MKEKKQGDVAVLLRYAGNYKGLTFLGLGLSAVAMILGMAPYICIWLAARDLIAVAPNWTAATHIGTYGWMAFGFSFGGILVYFAALMCTHLAAFRTAANIRKQGVAHLMQTPLGFFDNNGSGLLRNRLDGAASETETLLAHNLADIVGTAAMFLAMLVLMFVFDWRMGASCLLAAVVSVIAMATMMGGKNAGIMGIKWALMYRMTGSLYAGMADHFFNNCIATNLLHLSTESGTDELMIVRVLIAQLLSFAVVIAFWMKRKKEKKPKTA